MAADKEIRKLSFQVIQLSVEIRFLFIGHGKYDLPPVAGEGDDVPERNFDRAGFLFQRKELLLDGAELFQRLFQDAADLPLVIGFQDIVKSVDFIALEDIVRIGGYENQKRMRISSAQRPCRIHAAQFFHLNIQKEDVKPFRFRAQHQGFAGIVFKNLIIRSKKLKLLFQGPAKGPAHGWFIITDADADHADGSPFLKNKSPACRRTLI